MKILQILCAGGKAGIPTVARSLQSSWQEMGHCCDIVSLDKNEKEWLSPPSLLASYRLAKNPLFTPLYQLWADMLLERQSYDVVMAQYPPLDRFFLKAARKKKLKTAYFYQNVTDPKFYEGGEIDRRVDEDNRYLNGVKQVDVAFTASDFSARKVKEKTNRIAQVIPLGVDVEFWVPPITRNNSHDLVTLGRVFRHKGVKELLKSFAIVKKEIPDATLKVIGAMGDEVYTQECRSLAVEGVTFMGRLGDEGILKCFHSSSLFVSATLFEGFGLPFLEAAASGLPSVGFSLCSLPEVVKQGETGVLVEAGNIEEFAEKTIDLLRDSKKREKMSICARTWAEKFTWRETASAILRSFV